MNLKIIDDDGFIALVNSSNYKGFVDEDWQFDQIMAHFVNEMNAGNLVMWQTSNDGGGEWLVSLGEQLSETPASRQFDQFINVTSGELFLTNYADLTMAAQFSDMPVPALHNADLKIPLKMGWYKVTIKQLFDADFIQNLEGKMESPSFEINFTPSTPNLPQNITAMHWFEI